MGVANSLESFQQNMNDIFHGFYFICAYKEEIFILTKGDWKYHVHKLELTLNKPKEKGIKFNNDNSLFAQTEMKYLWF